MPKNSTLARSFAKDALTTLDAGGQPSAAVFGDMVNTATPNYTIDPTAVSASPAWLQGFMGAIRGTLYTDAGLPVQDLNAIGIALTEQLRIQQHEGVREWSATTTYPLGALTMKGYMLYISLVADNLTDPSTDPSWLRYNPDTIGTGAAGSTYRTFADGTTKGWGGIRTISNVIDTNIPSGQFDFTNTAAGAEGLPVGAWSAWKTNKQEVNGVATDLGVLAVMQDAGNNNLYTRTLGVGFKPTLGAAASYSYLVGSNIAPHPNIGMEFFQEYQLTAIKIGKVVKISGKYNVNGQANLFIQEPGWLPRASLYNGGQLVVEIAAISGGDGSNVMITGSGGVESSTLWKWRQKMHGAAEYAFSLCYLTD